MEILRLQLKNDVTQRIEDYIQTHSIDVDRYWLKHTINILITHIPFPLPSPIIDIDPHKCRARIWRNRTGLQCTHTPNDTVYCKKHIDMIKCYGVLRFGDMNEPKPTFDLIKQTQEPLLWEDPDPLTMLQQVLLLQSRKVIVSTPLLIIN